ncbi:MAG: metallophosphoesterase [Acidobacteriota bacterium]
MKVGALGDVHGDFASVRSIMSRHPDVTWWVSVGDLADGEGRYESPPAPLFWIKGNNDNLGFVAELASGRRSLSNLRYMPNGIPFRIGAIRVVGLGGTFAPSWYERGPGELPRPRLHREGSGCFPPMARDDKRRHFLRIETEACKRLTGIDLFLSHEAARPFHLEVRGRRQDVGKTAINEVLAALRPRMHLSGHHHVFDDNVRQGVRSIGLDPVHVSYLMIDVTTWKYERLET